MDWIAFFMFVVLFAAAMVGETVWLNRRGWASGGRSVAYVLITDLLSFGIGLFVCLSLALVIFMLVMGPSGTGSTGNEVPMWIAFVAALIFPPILLLFTKRVFLHFFKMQAGRSAWAYSLVVTLLIFATVLIPPSLLIYFVI